jgi:phosphoglycolate phosphatase-like HAD superfamily hydrolase
MSFAVWDCICLIHSSVSFIISRFFLPVSSDLFFLFFELLNILIEYTSYCRWCNIKPLPGANRLIKHLRSNGVPTALASNSPRSNIEAKISCHQGWKESFSAIVGGDEVEKGKPSPDM